jgi:hypothetical protein
MTRRSDISSAFGCDGQAKKKNDAWQPWVLEAQPDLQAAGFRQTSLLP